MEEQNNNKKYRFLPIVNKIVIKDHLILIGLFIVVRFYISWIYNIQQHVEFFFNLQENTFLGLVVSFFCLLIGLLSGVFILVPILKRISYIEVPETINISLFDTIFNRLQIVLYYLDNLIFTNKLMNGWFVVFLIVSLSSSYFNYNTLDIDQTEFSFNRFIFPETKVFQGYYSPGLSSTGLFGYFKTLAVSFIEIFIKGVVFFGLATSFTFILLFLASLLRHETILKILSALTFSLLIGFIILVIFIVYLIGAEIYSFFKSLYEIITSWF